MSFTQPYAGRETACISNYGPRPQIVAPSHFCVFIDYTPAPTSGSRSLPLRHKGVTCYG